MEPLYAKLYDKYSKLKAKKFGELDQLNKDQEVKFINYMTAAEELIQHLKDENDSLRAKIDELMASSGSIADEPSLEYQKLLIEETQKNRELSEEVEKLHKLQEKGTCLVPDQGKNDDGRLSTPESAKNNSDECAVSAGRSRRKRSRFESDTTKVVKGQTNLQEEDFHVESMSCEAHQVAVQPECCMRTDKKSDDSSRCECLFQTLIQCVIGMKFSVVSQTEGACLAAFHESSGYSFRLTWANSALGGDAEVMYNVLSLGTYERVAPEWMREVIKFSMNMCPIFFQRVARVIR